MSWWARLKAGAAEANAPRMPELDVVDESSPPDRRRSQRRRPSAAAERPKYPEVAPPPDPGLVHLDAGQLMAEGDVLAVEPRDVVQPEAGRHAWVIAIWYQVDPLELRNGGRFSLPPDQVVGTLQPTCWFCEEPWSFEALRVRCRGKSPEEFR